MLSRVADSLFWMSRYLERAGHTARVLNAQLYLMLERGAGTDASHWARVLKSLGIEDVENWAADDVVKPLIQAAAHPSSIVSCVTAARDNARQVREQVSSEMWEQLNRLFHAVKNTNHKGDVRDFLQSILEGTYLFQGVTDSTMTHGEGWQFIQAGRYLERAAAVSTLVSVHFRAFHNDTQVDLETLEWIGLLQSCMAFEAYCKAYTADLRPDRIAEFLVLSPVFPHSIRFAADALATSLKQIGEEASSRRASRVERIVGRMQATLAYGQMDEIMSAGLQSYLDTVRRQCLQVYNSLYQTYITYPVEAALNA
ncbi:MAG TPA: alpha-E domain-containing protein [Bryobacteraceae bacterium]|nr:alpha-E domain-containing protein [Bryobacteraceae bacterium]